MFLQIRGSAKERWNIVSDHLGNDGLAGGIFSDRTKNISFEMRGGMDAKVLSIVNVRATVARDEAPECQVGNVLHRREREERLVPRKQRVKITDRIHERAQSGGNGLKSISLIQTGASVRAILHAGDAFVLGAVSAAEHRAAGFVAVANDAAATVFATRGEGMDGAFEAIKIMRDAVGYDFQRLVVFVTADFAGLDAAMQGSLGLLGEFRFKNARGLLLLVTFDHTLTSRRTGRRLSGGTRFAERSAPEKAIRGRSFG